MKIWKDIRKIITKIMSENQILDNIMPKNKVNEAAEKDFQKRARNYERNSRWVTDKIINAIPLSFFQPLNSLGDLLDAGAGSGYLSWLLSQNISCNSVTLVDVSSSMLDKAKEKDYQILTHNSSIESFCRATDRKFDTILLRQVLHYIDSVDEVIRLLFSVLRDDGHLYVGQILVTDCECRDWHDDLMQGISKNRKRTFLHKDFLEYFTRNGFEIIKNEQTDFEDNLNDLFKRRTHDDTSLAMLKNKTESLISKSVRETLSIRITDDNIYFTVKFCHLLLKQK